MYFRESAARRFRQILKQKMPTTIRHATEVWDTRPSLFGVPTTDRDTKMMIGGGSVPVESPKDPKKVTEGVSVTPLTGARRTRVFLGNRLPAALSGRAASGMKVRPKPAIMFEEFTRKVLLEAERITERGGLEGSPSSHSKKTGFARETSQTGYRVTIDGKVLGTFWPIYRGFRLLASGRERAKAAVMQYLKERAR